MKKFHIKNIEEVTTPSSGIYSDIFTIGSDDMQVSDGYHTMDELYEHRIQLWIALCKTWRRLSDSLGVVIDAGHSPVWRSKLHADGSAYDGWYILGFAEEKGQQISYHLPMSTWEQTNFAETLDKAHTFDGHTSKDVLERLRNI